MGIVINNDWLNKNRNKESSSQLDRVTDYFEPSEGSLQGLKVLQLSLDVFQEIKAPLPEHLSVFREKLSDGMGVMSFVSLPGANTKALRSITDLKKSGGASFSRKSIEAIRSVAGAILNWISCITFISPIQGIKNIVRGLGFTNSVIGLQLTSSDYRSASKLENQATGEAKHAIQHTKNCLLLKLVRSVIALASTILGLGILMFGYAPLPAIILLTISAVSVFLGITSGLYGPSGRYKTIKFDREVNLP